MRHDALARAAWQRSSRCEVSNCVWVLAAETTVKIRDDAGGVLEFRPERWRAFVTAVKTGAVEI
jgi:hypothetical protein